MFSIWPNKDFVLLCKEGEWEDFCVKEITIKDFENEIIDLIDQNEYLLNIFSVGKKTGFVVDLLEFANDLNNEMSNYH